MPGRFFQVVEQKFVVAGLLGFRETVDLVVQEPGDFPFVEARFAHGGTQANGRARQ